MANRFEEFEGVPILSATRKAYHEMDALRLGFAGVASILKEGYDCGMRRRSGIVERCAERDGKMIKVVVERIISQSGIAYWRVRHVGMLSRR